MVTQLSEILALAGMQTCGTFGKGNVELSRSACSISVRRFPIAPLWDSLPENLVNETSTKQKKQKRNSHLEMLESRLTCEFSILGQQFKC